MSGIKKIVHNNRLNLGSGSEKYCISFFSEKNCKSCEEDYVPYGINRSTNGVGIMIVPFLYWEVDEKNGRAC